MTGDPQQMRAYVLGRLTPSEEEALELEVFGAEDDAPLEALEQAEAELLDALAAGELASEDASALTSRLEQTPRGRERLAFARALHASAEASRGMVAEPMTQARPWWRSIWVHLATGAALVAALVGLQLLDPEGSSGMSVSLEPTVLRSAASPPSVRLEQGHPLTLRLKLEADEPGQTFTVVVRSGKAVVARRTDVRPDAAREVVISLTSDEWTPGRLVIALTSPSGEPLAYYEVDLVGP